MDGEQAKFIQTRVDQTALVKLMQECVEVAKEASKALIFGLDSHHPDTLIGIREALELELGDLYAIMEVVKHKYNLDMVKIGSQFDKKIDLHIVGMGIMTDEELLQFLKRMGRIK